jgi:hypothetical protein
VNLPAGVTAATLVGDTVFVTMVNRYQFDPINPGAGAAGTMIFTVSSGSAVLGTLTLSGPARTIPGNGATTTAKVPVSGTVSSAGISLRVDVTSPQGSTMTLGNTSGQQFTFTAHTGTTAQGPIAASSANLSLTNQAVRPSPTDFSVDLGSGDRADSAQVFLTFANPFSVSGTVNVNFLGCVDANGNFLDSCPTFSTVISRAVPVAAGTTTATLKFGPPGAKALLNAKRIAFGGSVSGATPVTPAQSVSVTARVQVTMHTRSP